MNDTTSQETLSGIPLFATLSRESLSGLASLANIVNIEGGESIFHEGDEGKEFYVILEGSVELSYKAHGAKEEKLAVLESGECFGEMALIDDILRSADAHACENSTLLVITKRDFEDLLFVDRDAAYEILWSILRIFSSKFKNASDRLNSLNIVFGTK